MNSFKLRYVPIQRLSKYKDPTPEELLITGEIYCIMNSHTGERYVGQTTCAKMKNGRIIYAGYMDRYDQHVANAFSTNEQTKNACPKLYEAIRQYGAHAFFVILLERCLLGEMNQREIAYIRKFRCRKRGYNVTKGGQFAKYGKRKRRGPKGPKR